MEILTIEQIKALYPDQWVLVGNPELNEPNTLGSIVNRLIRGFVLSSSKDKRDLVQHAKELRVGYTSVACIYTGTFPTKRKWLL